jgi:hypothetical protein
VELVLCIFQYKLYWSASILDNMLAIAHVGFSPEGSIVRIWEWKGGTLPLENMLSRS